MKLRIEHTICYRYSRPVFLEPTIIRLQPRTDAAQRLLSFSLNVSPEPDGITHNIDTSSPSTAYVWFSGLHETFSVSTVSEVETLRKNPFDFVAPSEAGAKLPPHYEFWQKEALIDFTYLRDQSGEAKAFSEETARRSDGSLIGFLNNLNSRIHMEFDRIYREEGDAWSAEITIKEKKGSCRDLTVLFIESARAQGIAGRFVSGYAGGLEEGESHELHAWAEVYLPGGGWRGFDPTRGVAVGEDHVAVASASTNEGAMPLTGNFRGTDAFSTIDFVVEISRIG